MELSRLDEQLLAAVADLHSIPAGAVNIRKDGQGIVRRSSASITVVPKEDKPGIDILVKPGTKNEAVHIPVILTKSGFKDMVYNTFIIGEEAEVTVVAGCGIHNAGENASEHRGIHELIVKRGARLRYIEKHYGQGEGRGKRILDPKTKITVEEGGYAEMELVQIRGVDSTSRLTEAVLHDGAGLKIVEKLLTHGDQTADSEIVVYLEGKNSFVQVLSRSVAQDTSRQLFKAALIGKNLCSGHVECDAIIMDKAKIRSVPELAAESSEAVLTHEAAIGKIAGEQLIKLMTLGLDEKQAVETIISGFLR